MCQLVRCVFNHRLRFLNSYKWLENIQENDVSAAQHIEETIALLVRVCRECFLTRTVLSAVLALVYSMSYNILAYKRDKLSAQKSKCLMHFCHNRTMNSSRQNMKSVKCAL